MALDFWRHSVEKLTVNCRISAVKLPLPHNIISLNWSALKRSFLIGSLSGPNFPIRTAKMDLSRKDLTKSCFGKLLEERTVLCEVETLVWGEHGRVKRQIFKLRPPLSYCLSFWRSMEYSSLYVTPKRKFSRNTSSSSLETSPLEKRAKETNSPDPRISDDEREVIMVMAASKLTEDLQTN